MNKRIAIISALIIILVLTTVTLAFSKGKYQSVGEDVKSIKSRTPVVVATVNGDPITDTEIDISIAYNKSLNEKTKTKDQIFKDKIKFLVVTQEAKRLNLFPTDQEVSSFISDVRKDIANDENTKKLAAELYAGLGVTEDEYYKERFEKYRSQLAYGKLMNKIMDEEKGDENAKLLAFQNYIDDLVKKATVNITKPEYFK